MIDFILTVLKNDSSYRLNAFSIQLYIVLLSLLWLYEQPCFLCIAKWYLLVDHALVRLD